MTQRDPRPAWRLRRYVDDLLRGRRPRPFRADEEQAAQIRAAVTLRAARAGGGAPRDEFVTRLHHELAEHMRGSESTRPAGRTSRRLLVQLASAAAVGAAGAVVWQDARATGPATTAAEEDRPLNPDSGTWHTVLSSTELPEDQVQTFDVGSLFGFVHRVSGQVRAVSGVCSHQGCRLRWDRAGRELACPCHGATFALNGVVSRHEFPVAPPRLPAIPVREQDGAIQVFAP